MKQAPRPRSGSGVFVGCCFVFFFNLVCCAATACVCARSVIGGVVCGEDGEAFICVGEVGGGGATSQRLWLNSGGHGGGGAAQRT